MYGCAHGTNAYCVPVAPLSKVAKTVLRHPTQFLLRPKTLTDRWHRVLVGFVLFFGFFWRFSTRETNAAGEKEPQVTWIAVDSSTPILAVSMGAWKTHERNSSLSLCTHIHRSRRVEGGGTRHEKQPQERHPRFNDLEVETRVFFSFTFSQEFRGPQRSELFAK